MIKTDRYELYNGDCLEVMKSIPDKSVDMILCDLPYNITSCDWDNLIPFKELWEHYERIITDNGAIVLFASQPFTTDLINSNRKLFKHINYWNKENCGCFATSKYRPMPVVEDIVVFSKGTVIYNPQMIRADKKNMRPRKKSNKVKHNTPQPVASGEYKVSNSHNEKLRYPKNLLTYNSRSGELNSRKRVHPTQKPLLLCEWLIMSYSNENNIILDNCMGSGSTGVACMNTNRRFIGIELDENYFNIAEQRIEESLK